MQKKEKLFLSSKSVVQSSVKALDINSISLGKEAHTPNGALVLQTQYLDEIINCGKVDEIKWSADVTAMCTILISHLHGFVVHLKTSG